MGYAASGAWKNKFGEEKKDHLEEGGRNEGDESAYKRRLRLEEFTDVYSSASFRLFRLVFTCPLSLPNLPMPMTSMFIFSVATYRGLGVFLLHRYYISENATL